MSQQINLYNPIFLEKKKVFSAVTLAQGLVMILIGLVLFGVYGEYQVNSLRTEAANWGAQVRAVQNQLDMAVSQFTPREKSKTLADDVMRAEAELASQREVFAVVSKGGLGNTKGYSEYLRAFARQIQSGIWITGIGILGAGTEIELRGRALKADLLPTYINRLKSEPVMQGKNFANLDMQVPLVDVDAKNEKGEPVKQRGQANYIEFVLQTRVPQEKLPEEATAAESTRPAAPKEAGVFSLGGLK